jgi:hypothetical protein
VFPSALTLPLHSYLSHDQQRAVVQHLAAELDGAKIRALAG